MIKSRKMEAWRSSSTWSDSTLILPQSKLQDFSPQTLLSCSSAPTRRIIPSGKAGVQRNRKNVKETDERIFAREDLVLSMMSGLRHHNWRMRYHTWSYGPLYMHVFVFLSKKYIYGEKLQLKRTLTPDTVTCCLSFCQIFIAPHTGDWVVGSRSLV